MPELDKVDSRVSRESSIFAHSYKNQSEEVRRPQSTDFSGLVDNTEEGF